MTSIPGGDPQLVLHHFPGACSQVCVFALEHAALPYELRLVDLRTNEQASDAYKAISPLGKVPALRIDGQVLTENAAILTYIAELRPQAGLFPGDRAPLTLARRQAGLSLCGGTLHPIVRGLANPSRITEGDPEGVRRKSATLAAKSFGVAQARIAASGFWFDRWSLIDVYLNWAVSVAASAGFDLAPFPHLLALRSRLSDLPAFQRMLAVDAESAQALAVRREAA